MKDRYWPETVVLWGAGATKSLGLYATKDLVEILLKINKRDFSFLDNKNIKIKNSFVKLVTRDLIEDPTLSKVYDYKALEMIVGINVGINMHELFTMLDQLIENNMGYNAFYNDKTEFLRVERVIGAKRCLILLIEELERISIQEEPGFMSREKVEPYYKLSNILTELMKEESLFFDKNNYSRDTRKFYLYSYAMISFNWDAVLLWNIFNSNKKQNDNPIIFEDGLKLSLFSDFGTQIATADINDENLGISYAGDESQCRAVNNRSYPSRIMRIGKFLFPHGLFGSRICPECGKYITTFGGNWNRLSTEVFGPSVYDKLQGNWEYKSLSEQRHKRGAIECPYCGQITYAFDMPLIMQTMAKRKSIPKLEEVKTEMGLLMKNAKHIIFAGYSLPIDDIMVKTFFMSSLSGNDKSRLKCSVVTFDPDYKCSSKWIRDEEIKIYLREGKRKGSVDCIKNVCDIFNIDNVRVSLMGIPDVFAKNGESDKQSVTELLYPEEYFPGGFPLKR